MVEIVFSIRYFADVMLSACCVEWGLVLAVLLLDASLVNRVVQEVKVHPSVDAAVLSRVTQGYEELCDWADNEWWVWLHETIARIVVYSSSFKFVCVCVC